MSSSSTPITETTETRVHERVEQTKKERTKTPPIKKNEQKRKKKKGKRKKERKKKKKKKNPPNCHLLPPPALPASLFLPACKAPSGKHRDFFYQPCALGKGGGRGGSLFLLWVFESGIKGRLFLDARIGTRGKGGGGSTPTHREGSRALDEGEELPPLKYNKDLPGSKSGTTAWYCGPTLIPPPAEGGRGRSVTRVGPSGPCAPPSQKKPTPHPFLTVLLIAGWPRAPLLPGVHAAVAVGGGG